jgi:RHH-type transcriptional regulator, rel operon repressor / antitoxin RelB
VSITVREFTQAAWLSSSSFLMNNEDQEMHMSATKLISVRVTKEVAKRLSGLATATDRSKSYLASQAIEDFLALQEWQVAAIREGIEQADREPLLPHRDALKRLKRWRRSA